MTSQFISEKPQGDDDVEVQKISADHIYDVNEKVDYNRAGAIDAENNEHRMGVLEAVKAYPAASWWAFVMSSTIVGLPNPIHSGSIPSKSSNHFRSWRPTACS